VSRHSKARQNQILLRELKLIEKRYRGRHVPQQVADWRDQRGREAIALQRELDASDRRPWWDDD
jgi:hypothetical protein